MIPDTMTSRMPVSLSAGCIELRSGSVTLNNGGGRLANLPVVLKVYRTSLEHFAVLYPNKSVTCSKPIGFINLKNCNVGVLRRTLQIAQRSCDGGMLTFECADAKDAKVWLDVMENKSATKNSSVVNSCANSSGVDIYRASKQMRMNICTNLNLPIVQEEDIDEE